MRKEPYYIRAGEVSDSGENIPEEMLCGENLVYSSPATLSYNSPGAQGFGVKRAGLVIPESVMLLVSPACCGRNTTILADDGGYSDKTFFLQLEDVDLVTGSYLDDIPKAVKLIIEECLRRGKKPEVVVICITCADALLGTDLERVCRKASELTGVKVVPSYMYALTREGKNPPMVAIRETIYSLLESRERNPKAVNLIGHFSQLEDDSEIYALLKQIGIEKVREISRCRSFEEYLELGEANFNLILNPEARKAASMMYKNLGIPMAELTRLYQIDRIQRQYALLGAALGTKFDDVKFYNEAFDAVKELKEVCKGKVFSIGQVINANPVELALALTKYGLKVRSIFSNLTDEDMSYISELGKLDPEVILYSPLSPSMINYNIEDDSNVDITIGIDAAFYYPESINVKWNDEIQPFGYKGLIHLIECIVDAVNKGNVLKETNEGA